MNARCTFTVRVGDAGQALFDQCAAGGASVGQGLGMLLRSCA